MTDDYVIYLGRTIPKANFRAFVYGFDNAEKLVDSWEQFVHDTSSGEWFSAKKNVPAKKPNEKGRK